MIHEFWISIQMPQGILDLVLVHIVIKTGFLGGLSLHLNHLIASRVANYNWPFGTLPF